MFAPSCSSVNLGKTGQWTLYDNTDLSLIVTDNFGSKVW